MSARGADFVVMGRATYGRGNNEAEIALTAQIDNPPHEAGVHVVLA